MSGHVRLRVSLVAWMLVSFKLNNVNLLVCFPVKLHAKTPVRTPVNYHVNTPAKEHVKVTVR